MSLLDRIVAARRLSLARERARRAAISCEDGAAGLAAGPATQARRAEDAPLPALRAFRAALAAPGRRIIAEIKRRSPSAGVIRDPLDPAFMAAEYERAGAAALSVLTEPEFFGGSSADLRQARGAVSVPVLRKDFLLDREQVFESRALGADAVLLLASVLSLKELADLLAASREAGLEALVEVHDEPELEAALATGAAIVGVNSRDLRDFSVDLRRAERLASRIPDGILRVAESGIRTCEDVVRLEAAGYRAFLVGESLLRAPDPAAGLRELLG